MNAMRFALVLTAAMLTTSTSFAAPGRKLTPVPFTEVKLRDEFWLPRLETNRKETIPHDFKMCEETGRIDNFAITGGLKEGKFRGLLYDDSDVYKVIEGASYSLATHPDGDLDKYLDDLIAKIAAAQRKDGYLSTYYTLVEPDNRYKELFKSHELYCAGHLIEAAVAHHRATGKKTLLDVALKLADYIDSVFGENKRHDVDGHEEIELALFRLGDLTGEGRYKALAQFFIGERGNAKSGRKLYGEYAQDAVPAVELQQVGGHAVRMGYYLSGITDVAAATRDDRYLTAVDRLWENLVGRQMYVTGGIGSQHGGEAFGAEFELPNETAYAETCAAVANALWNHRMNLLHGDGKYADVLERITYNGFLSGVSLDGKKFFYVNPLASRGNHHRQEWFGTACCPVNVVRFLPSLPGYFYASGGNGIYVNLYASSEATVSIGNNNPVRIRQETKYPWEGTVKLTIEPLHPGPFPIYLRIPDWAVEKVTYKVNGESIKDVVVSNGYLPIHVVWQKGDTIELNLPMDIRRTKADPRVKADVGRIALQRGPIVYCMEAVDNAGKVTDLFLPADAKLEAKFEKDLLGGVVTITGEAGARTADGASHRPFKAIPYYSWDHRGPGEMAVWIPEEASLAHAPPKPTIANTAKASASHCWHADTVQALADGFEPENSTDQSIARFTWWDHKGGTEWVQYDFAKTRMVEGIDVYWFDDEKISGECRVPAKWRVLFKNDNGQWQPVKVQGAAEVKKDAFNVLKFDKVEATALRIEADLRPNFSGGILEWRVNGSQPQ